MTMVHHAMHGLGEVIASETTRGRTHFKVAFGPGTEVWMDETEVNLRTASEPQFYDNQQVSDAPSAEGRHEFDRHLEHWEEPHGMHVQAAGEDLFSYAPEMQAYRHNSLGYPEHAIHDGHEGYYGDVLGSTPRDRSGDAYRGGRDRGWDEHGQQDLGDWHPSDAYEFENRGPEDIYSEGGMGPLPGPHQQASPYDYPLYGPESGRLEEASIHEGFGSSAFAHEPPGPIIDYDNPPTYPYDPTPQFPVDMFRHEQTISPDHEIDLDKRTSPTKAITLDDAAELTYPGPNPELFAKSGARHYPHDEQANYENDPDYQQMMYGDDFDGGRAGEIFHNAPHSFGRSVEEASGDAHRLGGWQQNPEGPGYNDPGYREPSGGYGGPQPDRVDRHDMWMEDNPGEDPTESPFHPDSAPVHHRPRAEDMGFSRDDIARLKGRQGRTFQAAVYVDAADHFNDPIQQFRDDPVGSIRRLGGVDISAGLDYETGEWMRLVEADKRIFEGAWRDVAAKAKRLRREGAIEVEDMSHDRIYAKVHGDNGIYDTMISTGGQYGQVGQGVSNWRCSCDWGKWAFKRQFTFVGRLCSHAYAALQEMQSHRIKSDPEHPFNKRRRPKLAVANDDGSAGPEHGDGIAAFKSWIDAENQGHIDMDAADRFISTSEDPMDKAEAQKIYDYALGNVSERPERDYDQDGYDLDNEEHYKTGEVLRTQPNKLTPDLIVVPQSEGDDAHYFTDLGDDRKTTGPDQIMAAKPDPGQHHPSFAWHDDDQPDFPADGIVHFSSRQERQAALVVTADDDLLNKLRDLSEKPQSEDFGNMADRNEEISDVVKELRDRGYDVDQLVASVRRAMRRSAAPGDEDKRPTTLMDMMNAGGGGGGGAPSTTPMTVNPAGGSGLVPTGGGGGAPAADPTGGLLSGPVGGGVPNTSGSAQGAGQPGGGGGPGAQAERRGEPAAPGGGAPGGGAPAPGAAGPAGGTSGGGGAGGGGAAIGPGSYTVQQGDTLSGIADRAGDKGGYQDLVKGNPGSVGGSGTDLAKNPDLIHPGDQIKIPGGTATPAAGATDNGPHGAPGSAMNPTNATPGPAVAPPAASPLIGPGAGAAGQPNPTNSMTNPGLTNPAAPAGGAAPKLPPVGNNLSGIHGNIAERFAMLYFTADDGLDTGEDDKNKPRATMPTAPSPTGKGTDYRSTAPTNPANPTTNPTGAPAGPSGTWTQGPHGPIDTSGQGGANAENQIEHSGVGEGGAAPDDKGSPAGQGGSQGPLNTSPLGGIGDIGNIISEVGGMIPGIGGLASGIGSAVSGLGHMFGSADPERFASQYFQADGNFMGNGGGDWADYPFAGSGPARKDWTTTSEDYVDEHFKGDRDETWHTDNDGDITKYTTPPKQKPKQSRRARAVTPHSQQVHHRRADNVGSGDAGYGTEGGAGPMGGGGFVTTPTGSGMGSADLPESGMEFHQGSAPGIPGQSGGSREFWADAYDPSEQGYFNPRNRPYQEDDSDQYQQHGKGKGGKGGPPGGANPVEDIGGGGSAGEAAGLGGALEEAAPLLLAAGYDDGSDIVRQFQASGGGGVLGGGGPGGGGGRYNDDSIAGAAAAFLKTAGRNYSVAEQRAMEDEEHPLGARNLGGLDLTGTHYLQ